MPHGTFVELDLGAIPRPSGPAMLLLHAEESGACLLVLLVLTPDGRTRPAIATFDGCSHSVFGAPNDERSPVTYGFHEVTGSASGERHFLVAGHDATARFFARDVRLELLDGDFAGAVREAVARAVPYPPE